MSIFERCPYFIVSGVSTLMGRIFHNPNSYKVLENYFKWMFTAHQLCNNLQLLTIGRTHNWLIDMAAFTLVYVDITGWTVMDIFLSRLTLKWLITTDHICQCTHIQVIVMAGYWSAICPWNICRQYSLTRRHNYNTIFQFTLHCLCVLDGLCI